MFYLTIDTSMWIAVGVAVERDGEVRELSYQLMRSNRMHAEALAPMVKQVLSEAGIERPDAVVVGSGPGAFTGLRAGLMMARTLARTWGIPLYGVSSLEVLALAGADAGAQEVVAMIDARRREVYALRARPMGADDVAILSPERIVAPADLHAELSREPAVVAAIDEVYPHVGVDTIGGRVAVEHRPVVMTRLALSHCARRAAGEDIDMGTQPHYLRRPDIHGGHPQPSQSQPAQSEVEQGEPNQSQPAS
ncbi:tRNA (adenosine(37)-N6)-threonylcarbamoyltransferase complex dimerization subunit type 1 TsaB [Trueperella sp. LYQ143]|uniref:tRNA (adenosine(37)-N6)-threonylcarbamoyltransferase complex dimerization subunit type 1 TsaB n=1 Tax=unclassified Trueperella TaxID=2630174 RepID=UPI0039835F61